MRIKSPFLAKGVLVLLATALSFGAAELLIRVVSPQPIGRALPMYAPDSLLDHRLLPGFSGVLRSGEFETSIRINSLSFRGDEWTPSEGTRIVILGDSFTFGYGVEEHQAFPAIVERRLRSLGHDVEVYNAGVPGYGTLQEGGILREIWNIVEPNVVILAFTVGSDLRNIMEQALHPETGYDVKAGYLVPKRLPVGSYLPIKAFLQERSHLYVLLQKARAKSRLSDISGPQTDGVCNHFLARYPCGDLLRAVTIARSTIADMKSYCDKAGATFLLLAIPHPVQVYDKLWDEEVERMAVDADSLSRWGVQQALRSMANDFGVAMIDPLPVLRGETTERLYFRLDRHLTAKGHSMIAEAMEKPIEERLSSEVLDKRRSFAAN